MLGVNRSQHESLRSLWSPGISGGAILPAAFSSNRVQEISSCLRFDNRDTRAERRQVDKFAPFRELWNLFIDNCKKCYAVNSYVTTDEQLIPFRGRVPFKQYMPNKPDKYGMKLFLLCDCASGCTFNGMPYVGREGNERHVGLAEHVVKTLAEPLFNSGVNITTDNWFTNDTLAEDLLRKHITLPGTMRKNKPAVPPEFQAGKKRLWGRLCLDSHNDKLLFHTCRRQTRLLSCFSLCTRMQMWIMTPANQ